MYFDILLSPYTFYADGLKHKSMTVSIHNIRHIIIYSYTLFYLKYFKNYLITIHRVYVYYTI